MAIVLSTARRSVHRYGARRMRMETDDGKYEWDAAFAPKNIDFGGFGWVWEEIVRDGRRPLLVRSAPKIRTMSFDMVVANPAGGLTDQTWELRFLDLLANTGRRVRVTYGGTFENRYWRLVEYTFNSVQRDPKTSAITYADVHLEFKEASDMVISRGPVTGGVRPSGTKSVPKKTTTTTPKPSTKTAARYHTVVRGDTLTKLAIRYYHNSAKWRTIADANRITNPRTLPIGKRLRIP